MNQPYRIRDFTRRQVRDREQLFNPESSDWPVDKDHDANWDYFVAIICGFLAALAIGFLAIFGWVFWALVGWP